MDSVHGKITIFPKHQLIYEAHMKKVQGMSGLDEYGRKPAPGQDYYFSYELGKWVTLK
tara:strand:+ start:785 stop:958 length:174 start_codon:yes stop_codon:yes gene_type:complete